MSITRGHSFNPHDICNAQALNDLVRLAQISGLGVSDIGGSTVQISVFSAPSGAAVGWVSAEYERCFLAANASYTQFDYVLTTRSGRVALFKQFGLETNRFTNLEDTFKPGCALLIKTLGSPAASLQATAGYSTGYPQHQFIGSNYGTAASGTSAAPRIVMKGYADANVVDAGGNDVRHLYYLLNATTQQWQHSPGATAINKIAGYGIDTTLNGDTTLPMWLIGAPLWTV